MADRKLTVITYHAVDDRGDIISVTPARFRRQMKLLGTHGYRGVSLKEAFNCLEQNGTFPENTVVLTFDDAYHCVYSNALPCLEEFGFGATVFVPTAFVGMGEGDARQTNAHLGRDMMDWRQIKEKADHGIEIGAHTRSHPDLRKLDPEALEDELGGCRRELEDRLGAGVNSFAYPYGYWNERIKMATGQHFRHACTTQLGHNRPGVDPLRIRRLDAYYLGRDSTLVRTAAGGMAPWWVFRQFLRDLRARVEPGR